jgi:hypothetical protein
MEKPLVSIMIPTHNNSETLSRCLSSVLEQDYDNLLIAALDNHSSDDTYDILADFEKKFRDRLYIGRIYASMNPSEHRRRCQELVNPRSKFIKHFPATDVLAPTYVSRCIQVFESNSKAGCVMAHADVIKPSGAIESMAKCFPGDCTILGDSHMESLMANGFDLNTTELYRVEVMNLSSSEGLIFNRFPFWLPLVMASSIADIGFIHDSLALHGDVKSVAGSEYVPSLEYYFERYLFLQAFHTIATRLGRRKVCDQYPSAIRRLSMDCVSSSNQLFKAGDYQLAKSYLSLALAYLPEVAVAPQFIEVSKLLEDSTRNRPC